MGARKRTGLIARSLTSTAALAIAIAAAAPAAAQDTPVSPSTQTPPVDPENSPGGASSRSAATPEAPETAPAAPNAGDTQPQGPLGDIVVTAQRRETRLQETPVAITAVTAETFENLGARRVEDLARYTPGLFVQQATFSGAGGPSIRGIGSFSLIPSASFPVAFYYDGLFQDRPFGNNLRLFDIQRIEVLRGPQGVLFGRNATAGAIRVEFALPSDELAIRARVAYGDFDTREGQFSIRGPIADGVKLGISGTLAASDGYGKNLFNGQDVYGFNVENIRAAAVIDAIEPLTIILRSSYTREKNTFGLKQVFADNRGVPIPANNQFVSLFRNPALGIDEYANNFPSFVTVKRETVSAEFTYEFDGFDLVGLFGENRFSNISDSDTDGGDNVRVLRPTSIFNHTENRYRGRTAEVRVSSTGMDRLQLDAGLFYINERVSEAGSSLRFVSPTGVNLVASRALESRSETNAYAVFGHGAFDVSDKLTLRAGVRYSDEKKEGAAQSLNLVTNVALPRYTAETSFNAWTPSFGVDYKFTDLTFGYVTVNKGFKSGGFTVDPNTGIAVEFDQETVWNYEVGLKTDLFGRRLRVNTAAFYADYQDLQVTQNLPNGGAITNNAASARIYGVELETVMRPVDNFTVSASAAYLNAKYEDYLYISNPARPFNLKGYDLERAPRWKYSVVPEYVVSTPLGSLALQASLTYEDEVFFQSVPDSPVALAGPPPSPAFERSRLYKRRAIGLVDARIELTSPGDKLSVALFGSNLTNQRFYGALTRLGGGTSTIGNVNQPRAFRVELNYKY